MRRTREETNDRELKGRQRKVELLGGLVPLSPVLLERHQSVEAQASAGPKLDLGRLIPIHLCPVTACCTSGGLRPRCLHYCWHCCVYIKPKHFYKTMSGVPSAALEPMYLEPMYVSLPASINTYICDYAHPQCTS